MCLQRVSTRKVSKIVEELCGREITGTQVNRAAKELDETLEARRNRSPGECPYLFLDARYEKVTRDGVAGCSPTCALYAHRLLDASPRTRQDFDDAGLSRHLDTAVGPQAAVLPHAWRRRRRWPAPPCAPLASLADDTGRWVPGRWRSYLGRCVPRPRCRPGRLAHRGARRSRPVSSQASKALAADVPWFEPVVHFGASCL